ncbi:peptidase M14 [Bacillus xiamenensis]|uniref:Peptidase M14 n=1 Tax=Bacillus xiamenensis TaxID=1178537 RepID=A0AAC9IEU6_9BACI|nr:M14 family metallocarboxypeptidase [Bacillus xiamenensis]AOZ88002.1 peptidase M14 [Bacillus xiamenensis]EKF33854.1 M14 family carboxypeptidase [Bacillus xiamenensis]
MSKQKGAILSAAVCLMAGSLSMVTPVSANADTPYYGKNYEQPASVQKLYPEPDETFDTPAFQKKGEAFTTQEELQDFLRDIVSKSPYATQKQIGTSIEGRSIPAIYFTKDRHISPLSKKPTIWLQAQIHGNEPASGESALVIAKRLAGDEGERILSHVNVIIVPRINPDGSYAFDRRLANGMDGNRDHMTLESPELIALHEEFNRYAPEVVIDAHEYDVGQKQFEDIGPSGALKYHDLLILSGKNLNIPESIRLTSNELYVNGVRETLTNKGFSNDLYYTNTRGKDGKIDLYEGGTDARIGRNALALSPALSFLVESRGIGIGRENFTRRVAAQVITHEKIIGTTVKHAKQVKQQMVTERLKLVKKGLQPNDDDQVVIQDDFKAPVNDSLEMVDIEKGQTTNVPVRFHSASDAVPVLTRERPTAYLILPGHEGVERKLRTLGLKSVTLPVGMKVPVQAYQVTKREEKSSTDIQLETRLVEKKRQLPKGTKVYVTAQPETNLLSLALEPESKDSYMTSGFIASKTGDELPVYRFLLHQKTLGIQ